MQTQSSAWKNPLTLLIAGGILMGLALGIRHVQVLFLIPVTMDNSWSREAFGFAIALQNLIWGVAQPFTGMIADRFASAKVMAVGVASYALGLLLMSGAATPVRFTLSAGGLIRVGLSGTAFGAVYGALSRMIPPKSAVGRWVWLERSEDWVSSPWFRWRKVSLIRWGGQQHLSFLAVRWPPCCR